MEMRDCVDLANYLVESQGKTVPYIPFLKTAATTLFVWISRATTETDVPHLGEGNKGGGDYSISSLQLRHGIMGREGNVRSSDGVPTTRDEGERALLAHSSRSRKTL